MSQSPQSTRIIVLKSGEPSPEAVREPNESEVRSASATDSARISPNASAVDTDPGLAPRNNTEPGVTPAGTTVPMFLGIPQPATAVEVDNVEPDALLDSLAPRNLPEVNTTSGEVAAVYATEDATPAARHHTPVPEPAVIAPDPRREPTYRIPRDWVGPLDEMAKRAMAQQQAPSEPPTAKWIALGVIGGVAVIGAILLSQRLWPTSVKEVDRSSDMPASEQRAASTVAKTLTVSPTAAPPQVSAVPAEPAAAASTPTDSKAPKPKPSSKSTSSSNPPSEDPDYKLLK